MGFNLFPFVLALLVFAGLAVILRGFRGRAQWTHPACAKCQYDLRGLDPVAHKQCSECGADLAKPGAVHFGRGQRSYKVMALGVLLAISPLLIVGGQQVQTTMTLRVAQYRSNDAVIAELATDAANARTWNELLDRHYDGRLTDDDIAAAVDHLIAHLEATGGTGNRPLGWPAQFVTVVLTEGRVKPQQFARLCRAYYSRGPEVRIPQRVRSDHEFMFDVDGVHWDLDGVTTIMALREVTLNGEPVTPKPWGPAAFSRGRSGFSGSGAWGMKGNLTLAAEPGDHELVFVIDFGAVESHRGAFGPHSPPGPVGQWPETIFQEVQEVRVPFTMLAPDESPIALVAPAHHREAVVSGLRVTALRFGFSHGMQTAELVFNPARQPPVPLSFKVFVSTGNFEEEIGSFTSRGGGMGKSGFRRQLRNFPEAETVDVIFRPDPKAVEGRAEWTEIWGEEIVIEGVRVVRPGSQKEMNEQAMRAALHVHAVDPGGQRGRRVQSPTLHMMGSSMPVPARFRVYIRSGDYEHHIATITAHEHGWTRRGGRPATDLPEDAQTVTVIFRPDLDELTDEQRKEYWNEEVVFENVPVVRTPMIGPDGEG